MGLTRLVSALCVMASVSFCHVGLDTHTTSQISYQLEWASEGELAEVETDLGYRVRLSSGSLRSYSLQLIPCESAVAQAPGPRTFFGIRSAHAGHGSGDYDASLVVGPAAPMTRPGRAGEGPTK